MAEARCNDPKAPRGSDGDAACHHHAGICRIPQSTTARLHIHVGAEWHSAHRRHHHPGVLRSGSRHPTGFRRGLLVGRGGFAVRGGSFVQKPLAAASGMKRGDHHPGVLWSGSRHPTGFRRGLLVGRGGFAVRGGSFVQKPLAAASGMTRGHHHPGVLWSGSRHPTGFRRGLVEARGSPPATNTGRLQMLRRQAETPVVRRGGGATVPSRAAGKPPPKTVENGRNAREIPPFWVGSDLRFVTVLDRVNRDLFDLLSHPGVLR